MSDFCESITIHHVMVQENGIVRNSHGYAIARLDGISFLEVKEREDAPHKPPKPKGDWNQHG